MHQICRQNDPHTLPAKELQNTRATLANGAWDRDNTEIKQLAANDNPTRATATGTRALLITAHAGPSENVDTQRTVQNPAPHRRSRTRNCAASWRL